MPLVFAVTFLNLPSNTALEYSPTFSTSDVVLTTTRTLEAFLLILISLTLDLLICIEFLPPPFTCTVPVTVTFSNVASPSPIPCAK